MCAVKLSNNRIKEIIKLHQKKYRDESGLFLAEGEKTLEEILNSDINIKEIIALEGFNSEKINYPYIFVDENIMKKITTTSTLCNVLVVAEKKSIDISQIKTKKKIALFDSISDPGNLGTIIRSAAAFGIEGIILYGNCVDLYSPKVIRSCAGNFLKIPVVFIKNIEELNKNFKDYTKISTAIYEKNNISIKEAARIEKYIVMFGSEASGLQEELVKIADKNIRLQMENNVESLNLSVSASIIFYELFLNNFI